MDIRKKKEDFVTMEATFHWWGARCICMRCGKHQMDFQLQTLHFLAHFLCSKCLGIINLISIGIACNECNMCFNIFLILFFFSIFVLCVAWFNYLYLFNYHCIGKCFESHRPKVEQ